MSNAYWIVDPLGFAVDIIEGRAAALRRLDAIQRRTRIAHHIEAVES